MTILTESSHSMATVRYIYKNWIGHIIYRYSTIKQLFPLLETICTLD